MLALNNRLKKQKDFENVFKNGKGFKKKFLYLKINKNGLEFTRFGFVVSTKVSKKAVERNRLKRIFRDIVRKNLERVVPGLDAVIVANPGIEIKREVIEESLNTLFYEGGIFKNN